MVTVSLLAANRSLDIIGSCSGHRELGHWRLLASLCLGGRCARHWTIGRGLGRIGLSRARKTRSLMQRRMIMITWHHLSDLQGCDDVQQKSQLNAPDAHDAHGKCINVWSHLQPSLICGARQIKQKQAQVESIEADLPKQILQETGRFELLSRCVSRPLHCEFAGTNRKRWSKSKDYDGPSGQCAAGQLRRTFRLFRVQGKEEWTANYKV